MFTEVKVKASALGTLIASCTLAILNEVTADSSVLGGLPAWLQFVILAVLPPVIAFLSGYAKTSSTSSVSKGFDN